LRAVSPPNSRVELRADSDLQHAVALVGEQLISALNVIKPEVVRHQSRCIDPSKAIRKAHAAGIKIGICGQAPSNYGDFAEFLVREGIDSISLNPDSFVKTSSVIAGAEATASG